MNITNIKEYIEESGQKSPYLTYANNHMTQFGEDGIIRQLMVELDLISEDNVVCEFGAWDGVYLSNVYDLWRYNGLKAILIESNGTRLNELNKISTKYSNVNVIGASVSSNVGNGNSLDNLIDNLKLGVNDDNFALLSIDVDGADYHIWSSIEKYRPIIVLVEIAGGWGIDEEYIGQGASLKSLYKLGLGKGYTLVCSTGNAFFVRDDKVSSLKHFDKEATHQDYYIADELVNSILSNLNEDGDILEYVRFNHPSYLTIVEEEKANL